jgi:hypothetical protein
MLRPLTLELVHTKFSKGGKEVKLTSFRQNHAGDTGSAGALSVFICDHNIPTAQSPSD